MWWSLIRVAPSCPFTSAISCPSSKYVTIRQPCTRLNKTRTSSACGACVSPWRVLSSLTRTLALHFIHMRCKPPTGSAIGCRRLHARGALRTTFSRVGPRLLRTYALSVVLHVPSSLLRSGKEIVISVNVGSSVSTLVHLSSRQLSSCISLLAVSSLSLATLSSTRTSSLESSKLIRRGMRLSRRGAGSSLCLTANWIVMFRSHL
mmetsp:Transcript_29207/g.72853  ORF Transcript_29207/g.72853 Transcript_29207/m.72853 type:complete len:205 (-) Transcript_29207:3250-3864(-)